MLRIFAQPPTTGPTTPVACRRSTQSLQGLARKLRVNRAMTSRNSCPKSPQDQQAPPGNLAWLLDFLTSPGTCFVVLAIFCEGHGFGLKQPKRIFHFSSRREGRNVKRTRQPGAQHSTRRPNFTFTLPSSKLFTMRIIHSC